MSASKVQICNMALSGLGSKQTIQDIASDQSVEARTCLLHYDQALETTLTHTDWTFATTWATSSKLSADPPSDWLYMYARPANYLHMIEIINAAGVRTDRPRKLIQANYAGQRVILTDTEAPVWRYLFLNTNPATYSPSFVDALVANLQARIAMPLTRKPELKKMAAADYLQLVSAAAAHDANQNSDNAEPDYTAEWFEDRGYTKNDPYLVTNTDGSITEYPGNM